MAKELLKTSTGLLVQNADKTLRTATATCKKCCGGSCCTNSVFDYRTWPANIALTECQSGLVTPVATTCGRASQYVVTAYTNTYDWTYTNTTYASVGPSIVHTRTQNLRWDLDGHADVTSVQNGGACGANGEFRLIRSDHVREDYTGVSPTEYTFRGASCYPITTCDQSYVDTVNPSLSSSIQCIPVSSGTALLSSCGYVDPAVPGWLYSFLVYNIRGYLERIESYPNIPPCGPGNINFDTGVTYTHSPSGDPDRLTTTFTERSYARVTWNATPTQITVSMDSGAANTDLLTETASGKRLTWNIANVACVFSITMTRRELVDCTGKVVAEAEVIPAVSCLPIEDIPRVIAGKACKNYGVNPSFAWLAKNVKVCTTFRDPAGRCWKVVPGPGVPLNTIPPVTLLYTVLDGTNIGNQRGNEIYFSNCCSCSDTCANAAINVPVNDLINDPCPCPNPPCPGETRSCAKQVTKEPCCCSDTDTYTLDRASWLAVSSPAPPNPLNQVTTDSYELVTGPVMLSGTGSSPYKYRAYTRSENNNGTGYYYNACSGLIGDYSTLCDGSLTKAPAVQMCGWRNAGGGFTFNPPRLDGVINTVFSSPVWATCGPVILITLILTATCDLYEITLVGISTLNGCISGQLLSTKTVSMRFRRQAGSAPGPDCDNTCVTPPAPPHPPVNPAPLNKTNPALDLVQMLLMG